MDLLPFDLSRAMAGSKVVTSDGSRARIITCELTSKFCLAVAVAQASGDEVIYQYDTAGKCITPTVSALYILPEYRTYYIVTYQKTRTNTNDLGSFVCNSAKEAQEFIAKNVTAPGIAFYNPAVSEIVRAL